MPLDSRTNTFIRNKLNTFLEDSVVIQRRTATPDEFGFTDTAFSSVGTVTCRTTPYQRQDNDGVAALAEQGRSYFNLYVSYDVDIRDGDQVVFSGDTYQVLQIHDTHTDRADKQAIIARLGT